ncbi:hypothetical protein [Pandoraea pnomenusa]|uniref:hypothetical protein n=1 Tax=Pandoraea pnomenusa TaxID=93220 RepID=UPI0033410372
MSSTCTTLTGTLQISLREARLTLDRALLETGMPYGFNNAVRECVLISEARRTATPVGTTASLPRMGGFRHFMDSYETLRQAKPDALQIGPAHLTAPLQVECCQQHAWVVAQMLLDLLLAEHAEREATQLDATGVTEPHELQVITWLAQRHGANVSVHVATDADTTGGRRVTLTLLARRLPPKDAADDALRSIIHHGLPVDAALWWSMYHLALGALAPDNVVSRRHAGANIVDETGTVIGRPTDDDTDFSLLTRIEPREAATGDTPA